MSEQAAAQTPEQMAQEIELKTKQEAAWRAKQEATKLATQEKLRLEKLRQRQVAEQQAEARKEVVAQQELSRQHQAAQQELMRAQQEFGRKSNARGLALQAAATLHAHGVAKGDVLHTAEEFAEWILNVPH
jgi:hypothetical protein